MTFISHAVEHNTSPSNTSREIRNIDPVSVWKNKMSTYMWMSQEPELITGHFYIFQLYMAANNQLHFSV